MMLSIRSTIAIAASLVCFAAILSVPAFADDAPPRKAFRVCSDPGNLPFSNEAGQGFENKIAEVFAKSLNLPLEYYFLPNRINFVRNTLRFKLPDEDYRCDIIMGVPEGFGQVANTDTYFRSTHVLAYIKGRKIPDVKSVEEFLALADKLNNIVIGVYDRSPASMWLVKHGLVDVGKPYKMLDADPSFYPGQLIEKDLVEGKIDVAIVWGPVGGFAAKRMKDTPVQILPMKSEPQVKFDFGVAMGVRRGEDQWQKQINQLIAANKAQIMQILREYRVPLVNDNGEPIP